MIEANNQIETLGIENYMQRLKKRYMQASTT